VDDALALLPEPAQLRGHARQQFDAAPSHEQQHEVPGRPGDRVPEHRLRDTSSIVERDRRVGQHPHHLCVGEARDGRVERGDPVAEAAIPLREGEGGLGIASGRAAERGHGG